MKISDNIMVQQAVDRAVSDDSIPWDKLKGSRILVTGATGLIGGQLALSLLNANKERALGLTVLAAVRNEEKARALFKYADGVEFVVQDITEPFSKELMPDYIIHGASMTGSRDFVDRPAETIATALRGTENLLELAAKTKVKSMVYLSSLEVYGVVELDTQSVTEDTNGRLDSMSVRSSYSESKRMAECMCAAYASEYGVPAKVVRLCQTFGAGVSRTDNRVFAQFARSVTEGKDIVLKTDGSTERNYCSVDDAIRAILTVLLKGETGQAYNAANPDTFISIRGMAELLINRYPQSGSKLVFDIAPDAGKLGYNPKVRLNLCTDKLQKLGWKAKIGLEQMFDELIAGMNE